MNVTVQDLAPCKKLVRIEIDAPTVDQTWETVTAQFQKQVRLPGFRPGKTPRHLILGSYARDIETEVRKKLISEYYRKGIEQLKLHAVTSPDIEELQFAKGQAMQFTATVETAPDFELPEYKGLAIKRESAVVTEADIDRALNALREQRASYQDVQRPVQPGDVAVINYKGSCEGKPITEVAPTARGLAEKSNFWVRIEPGQFVPGFTEQLIGAQPGEKKTLPVEFPTDFVAQPLAGKKGSYEVEVVGVKQKMLPELNDAFAVEFKAADLDVLREGVRHDLQTDLNYRSKRNVRDQIITQLLAGVNCELPEAVVLNETRSVVYDIVRENTSRGVPKDVLDAEKDKIFSAANSSAKDRIKSAFILARIARAENIRVQDEEISQRIVALAMQNNMKPERLAKQLQERGGIQEIHEQILQSKVLDAVELQAKIEEVLPANAQVLPAQPV